MRVPALATAAPGKTRAQQRRLEPTAAQTVEAANNSLFERWMLTPPSGNGQGTGKARRSADEPKVKGDVKVPGANAEQFSDCRQVTKTEQSLLSSLTLWSTRWKQSVTGQLRNLVGAGTTSGRNKGFQPCHGGWFSDPRAMVSPGAEVTKDAAATGTNKPSGTALLRTSGGNWTLLLEPAGLQSPRATMRIFRKKVWQGLFGNVRQAPGHAGCRDHLPSKTEATQRGWRALTG